MTKFKGTKGVWNINKHSSTTVECKGRSIATTGGYSDNSNMEQVDIENLANAKLIAAAPDLLEALEYYFDVLEEVRGKDWKEKPDHVMAKMLNAVSKATE